MRIYLVCLCLVVGGHLIQADIPTVPNNIQFAGLNLKLTDKARKKIQAEVDALTRYPKYFQVKVDRLQIYFPIIERVFREEGLPEDFKFLVLQESALISDAVSTSNAVGFWQFKKAAAAEVGLRVDRHVDERLNIVASTRGAAKYIKKNNLVYFDNWVHALLAYQQGPGGALKLVDKKYQGRNSMPIDHRTHWYVIKFLAHKIAFEQVKSAEPKLYLMEYYEGQGETLKDISQQMRLDFDQVQLYNKWLRHGKVPGDKSYAVILPYEKQPAMLAYADNGKAVHPAPDAGRSAQSISQYQTHPTKYPVIKTYNNHKRGIKINGIRGIRLRKDMDVQALSEATGVSTKRLLFYNDVPENKKPQDGELWYLRRKRSKAKEYYHVVEEGESLWWVSQKYGIRLKRLKKKNRISKRQSTVKADRVLWLRKKRPSEVPVAYQLDEWPEINQSAAEQARLRVTSSTDSVGHSPMAPTEQDGTPVETSGDNKTAGAKESPNREELATSETSRQEQKSNETLPVRNDSETEKLTKKLQKVHEVQAGETLYSISRRYRVTVEDLAQWNQLSHNSVLSIGQQLLVSLPVPPTESEITTAGAVQAEFIIHKVKQGETLYQIARNYNTTIKQLMEWNQKTEFDLRVGEELKVAGL